MGYLYHGRISDFENESLSLKRNNTVKLSEPNDRWKRFL